MRPWQRLAIIFHLTLLAWDGKFSDSKIEGKYCRIAISTHYIHIVYVQLFVSCLVCWKTVSLRDANNCLYHVKSVGKAISLRDTRDAWYSFSNWRDMIQTCMFHWIYYLKKSKQRGTIVYITSIVTSRHSNNSKIRVRWDFPDGDSAMFTKTSLGFSCIPNLWRHESSSD